jgi:hypothetical protein
MNISGIEIDMTDISGIEESDGARSPIPRRGGGRGVPSPKLGVPPPKLGVPPPKLGVLIGASTESEDDEAVRSPLPVLRLMVFTLTGVRSPIPIDPR